MKGTLLGLFFLQTLAYVKNNSYLRHAPSPLGWVPSEFTFASCGIYASRAFFCRPLLRRFCLFIAYAPRISAYTLSEAYFGEGVRQNPGTEPAGGELIRRVYALSEWF